jgi:hypothetical protein
MALESRFTGREEKRLPIMIEARLALAEGASERQERGQVENISALGARVYASRPWQRGEQVEIAPVIGKQLVIGEQPLRGEVIYCQKQADGRFVIGLKFRRNPGMSSMLEKLKGLMKGLIP